MSAPAENVPRERAWAGGPTVPEEKTLAAEPGDKSERLKAAGAERRGHGLY